jgi:tRNA-specific 2-thiouridylase
MRVGLAGINWLAPPDDGAEVMVKLRSAQTPVPATLIAGSDDTAELTLAEPVMGAAPGQAGVLYDGARVLGGGWIRRVALPPRPDEAAASGGLTARAHSP